MTEEKKCIDPEEIRMYVDEAEKRAKALLKEPWIESVYVNLRVCSESPDIYWLLEVKVFG